MLLSLLKHSMPQKGNRINELAFRFASKPTKIINQVNEAYFHGVKNKIGVHKHIHTINNTQTHIHTQRRNGH